jgi:hypothetical protein
MVIDRATRERGERGGEEEVSQDSHDQNDGTSANANCPVSPLSAHRPAAGDFVVVETERAFGSMILMRRAREGQVEGTRKGTGALFDGSKVLRSLGPVLVEGKCEATDRTTNERLIKHEMRGFEGFGRRIFGLDRAAPKIDMGTVPLPSRFHTSCKPLPVSASHNPRSSAKSP